MYILYIYVCVYLCNVVCVCANVYSMNRYVYVHTSMYISSPVDVVGVLWVGGVGRVTPLCIYIYIMYI